MIHPTAKIIDLGNKRHRVFDSDNIIRLINAVSQSLLKLPYQSNIAIVGVNSAEWIMTWLGIQQAGHIAIPINFRLPKEQFDFCLTHCNPALIFCDTELKKLIPEHYRTVELNQDFLNSLESSSDPLPVFDSNRIAHIIYTSGSTNIPKGVVTDCNSRNSKMQHLSKIDKIVGRHMVSSPFYHVAGSGIIDFLIRPNFALFLLPTFDPDTFSNAIKKFKIAAFNIVPGAMNKLLRYLQKTNSLPIDSVFGITLVADRVRANTVTEIKKYFPRAGIYNSYGMTELGGDIFVQSHPRGLSVPPDSVGYPGSHVSLKLIDGILAVKSQIVFQKYYKTDHKDCFDNEGYFITNDIFYTDDNGFYYYVGRADNMIKINGEKLYPTEAEQIINNCPGIKDCAVLGLPDDMAGNRIYTFIVTDSTVPPVALQNFVASTAPSHYIPKQVWELPELPLTAAGKTDYKELHRLALKFLN